jgi:hypothetical protein
MGKSRAVDELGKSCLVVPMNLRGEGTTGTYHSYHSFAESASNLIVRFAGYPPPDTGIRDFLTAAGTQTQAYFRAAAFLQSLFKHVAVVLKSHEAFREKHFDEFAPIFRNLMVNGGSFSMPSGFRRDFFAAVRTAAEELFAMMVRHSS